MPASEDFYIRYYVGHKGKFGHEFLEFEFRPDGKMRYANNSNYKNDTMIRKEAYVNRCVLSGKINISSKIRKNYRKYGCKVQAGAFFSQKWLLIRPQTSYFFWMILNFWGSLTIKLDKRWLNRSFLMSTSWENPRKILKKFSAYAIFKKLANLSFRLGSKIRFQVENRSLRNRPNCFDGVYWFITYES